MNTLCVCLRFSQLSLDISQRGLPLAERREQALAITEKQHIFLASKPAAEAGVCPGMTLSSAWALLPTLTTIERQPEREQRTLTRLANWAYQFTPGVHCGEDNSVLLEVGGSLRLFGGLEALLERIEKDLSALGFHYWLGLAHTQKAAELLPYPRPGGYQAEDCLESLQGLPLQQLMVNRRLSTQMLKKLQRVGLSTLGELLDMPRPSIGKRFGKGLLLFLQQVCGETPDPLPQLNLRPEFDSELHFLSGLSTVAMIRQPVIQLLEELQAFLIQRQLACRHFRWRFFHFDRQASVLEIDLSRPQQRWENFLKLSELKLEQVQLDSAIESIQLYTDALSPVEAESQGLFKELSNNALQETNFLIDKLNTRLGPERLYTLHMQDENLPELQQKRIPASSKSKQPDLLTSPATHSASPPLWLCEQALAISTRNEKLYYQGPLDIVSSPRRFDSHWWQTRQQRDYFVARHELGAHYWVYFEHRSQRWFLHGLYA